MQYRHRHQRHRQQRNAARLQHIVVFGLVFLLLMTIGGIVAASSIWNSLASNHPELTDLHAAKFGEDTWIKDRQGRLLAVAPSTSHRRPQPYSRMGKWLPQATVAIEDRRFWEHNGIDIRGIVRAAWINVQAGSVVQGGSTITQQVIKNLFESQDQQQQREGKDGLQRKVDELFLAPQLEHKYSKRHILALYLNSIPFGHNAIGADAAAYTYFDRPARQLNLSQAATLAGIIHAPSADDPVTHPQRAIQRRNQVLGQMLLQHKITPTAYRLASQRRLRLAHSTIYTRVRQPSYVAAVLRELESKYGRRQTSQGGLQVVAAIDLRRQRLAQQTLRTAPAGPEAAIASIDARTGAILVAADKTSFRRRAFSDVWQGQRQPGSTFKPIVLAAALKQANIDPQQVSYRSGSFTTDLPGSGTWSVANDDGSSSGAPRNLYDAMVHSDNTVFAQLTMDVGAARVIRMAHSLGISDRLGPAGPAIGLGGLRHGVTPVQLASAYSTFANNGRRLPVSSLWSVRSATGQRMWTLQRRHDVRVLSNDMDHRLLATLVANAQSGTATAAQLPNRPIWAKTGTTSTFKDAWLAGGTTDMVTVVWMGYQRPRPLLNIAGVSEVFGGTIPAALWQRYMAMATAGMPVRSILIGTQGSAATTLPDSWVWARGLGINNEQPPVSTTPQYVAPTTPTTPTVTQQQPTTPQKKPNATIDKAPATGTGDGTSSGDGSGDTGATGGATAN